MLHLYEYLDDPHFYDSIFIYIERERERERERDRERMKHVKRGARSEVFIHNLHMSETSCYDLYHKTYDSHDLRSHVLFTASQHYYNCIINYFHESRRAGVGGRRVRVLVS
jgi:hypothetical protein